jgi:superfamily II DNA/RNA helicase
MVALSCAEDAVVFPADVDLGAALMANVQRCKYTKPTPVQRYSIPIGLAGRDLMACAQTGSGKTAAFCFPIIANILRAGTPPAPRARKASASGQAHALWLITIPNLTPSNLQSVQLAVMDEPHLGY